MLKVTSFLEGHRSDIWGTSRIIQSFYITKNWALSYLSSNLEEIESKLFHQMCSLNGVYIVEEVAATCLLRCKLMLLTVK